MAPDEPGVPRRAARHDDHPLDRGALLGAQVQAVEPSPALLEQQPAPQGAAHRLGLLADLLEHEVWIAAQLDGLEIPRDVLHRAQLDVGFGVDDVIAGPGEHRDVAVVEIHHGTGVLEDRRRIGGDEHLAVSDP
jgi:hypothetical protein